MFSMALFLIFQLPKPKSKHQPVAVRLDFSDADDDEVQNTNANANGRSSRHHSNGQSSSTFAAYLEEEENSSDRNFIDDDSVSDEYSDSSYSGRNRKKPKKRQQRSPKKRAANGRKPSYKVSKTMAHISRDWLQFRINFFSHRRRNLKRKPVHLLRSPHAIKILTTNDLLMMETLQVIVISLMMNRWTINIQPLRQSEYVVD